MPTSAHFFFIPIVFFLGLFFGGLLPRQRFGVAVGQLRRRATSAKAVALAFAVFALVFVFTHLLSHTSGAHSLSVHLGGQPIFDQRPSFSSVQVYDRLTAFGEEGRSMYQKFTYTDDVVFPLSLLVFVYFLGRFVGDRSAVGNGLRLVLLGLPLVWFGFDMLENAMVYQLIGQYPLTSETLGNLLGLVTVTKFALLLACVVVPATTSILFRRRDQIATAQS